MLWSRDSFGRSTLSAPVPHFVPCSGNTIKKYTKFSKFKKKNIHAHQGKYKHLDTKHASLQTYTARKGTNRKITLRFKVLKK
jgi:hypothetical protein